MKIAVIQIIFLFVSTCLNSQDHKYSLEGSFFASISTAPNANHFFSSTTGAGTSLDIKRLIYQDDINSLYVGISNQFIHHRILRAYPSSNLERSYYLNIELNNLGHGLLVKNRFSGKFKKLTFFLDLGLKAMFHWNLDSYSYLEEREDGLFSTVVFNSQKLNTKFIFRNPVFYLGFAPGLEFNRKNKIPIFISIKYEKSMNGINEEISFSPLFPKLPEFPLTNFGINAGIRF